MSVLLALTVPTIIWAPLEVGELPATSQEQWSGPDIVTLKCAASISAVTCERVNREQAVFVNAGTAGDGAADTGPPFEKTATTTPALIAMRPKRLPPVSHFFSWSSNTHVLVLLSAALGLTGGRVLVQFNGLR
jgi:hypothetical protein